jgi:serine/threonine-protein kinase
VLREATGPAARRGLLRLVTRVAGAYARLHARGVLHGDVHPRNVLVQRDGTVRLIDFGWAWRPVAGDGGGRDAGGRGGVPFFYEPELARAYRLGEPPPPPTPAGEQYAVAVLLYLLVTGAYPRDYPLGRDEMLAEITDLPPLDFRQRGVAPWPALEGALARALAKDPVARHPSLLALAAALEEADEEPAATPAVGRRPRGSTGDPLASVLDACLAAADLGGEWLAAERLAAPSASVNYGAAGVALALLGVAQARRDGHPLALAQVWLERARRDVGTESGFYNDEIEIRRDTVGEASPFHGEAGIHAVAALLARARGDLAGHGEAVDAFLAASERPVNGLDLTLGRSACLLGAALLLDATPEALGDEVAALRAFGDRHLAAIWEALDREPAIPRAAIDYLGIAHGWAGLLYASLTWCAVSGAAPPPSTEGRAAELAALAVPEGRGLTWPWTLSGEGRQSTMPGWCNGSCGYVFLWTLLHRASGDPRYLDLAVGAAWDAWDAPDLALSLCCGLAGRAYALLDLHRATGDAVWLERARALAARGARQGVAQMDGPHALYKGALGLALLAADVERPETARMPLFEPYGYRSGGGRTRVEGVAPIPRHTDAGPPAEGTGTAPPPPLATGS